MHYELLVIGAHVQCECWLQHGFSIAMNACWDWSTQVLWPGSLHELKLFIARFSICVAFTWD